MVQLKEKEFEKMLDKCTHLADKCKEYEDIIEKQYDLLEKQRVHILMLEDGIRTLIANQTE